MKPQIPIPCHEDWDQMKIGQLSRHCSSCQKDVIDFTTRSRHEILAYLIENRNQEVCGRVMPSQLDYRHEEIMVTIRALEKKHRNTNLSYYLLTMATLSMMACESNSHPAKKDRIETVSANETPTTGMVINRDSPFEQPSVKEIPVTCNAGPEAVTGDMMIIPEHTSGMMIAPPEIEPPKVLPAPDEPVMVGEIAPGPEARMIAEVMPEFKGGTDSLFAYISRNLEYPKWEKKNGIQGKVYATFVIDSEGKVRSPQILKSVPGSKNFDKEVLRLLKHMPDWISGSEKGVSVPVQFNLPFKFEL